MGDQLDNNSTNMQAASFSAEHAESAARIASLANIYETAYYDGKDRTVAMSALNDAMPSDITHANVINIDNTTAIIAYNPSENRVSIAFDPTHTGGDRWDNFRRGHKDHDLGGEVHKGLYQDIVEHQNDANFPGDTMTDVMAAILHDYASRNPDQPLSVDFVGFSSGGAQTSMAAGQMIAEGFFEDNPNIKLDNVFTFGPPAYGNQDFINALEGEASKLGADVWMVQVHGDNMPSVLSPDGSNMFTKFDYGHAGDHAYIVPGADGQQAQILINPSEETIDALPDAALSSKEAHTMDSYINTLDGLNNADGQSNGATIEPEQNASPATIGLK